MAFDNSFVEEIKMNINIVDVIGRDVQLKKSGSNYTGLCPFHSEKTPSFSVNEEKQIFHCFGCGESGDVISFVQKYNKIPFMEACEKLCSEYGIKMPERTHKGPKIDYDKFYSINSKTARFYFDSLTAKKNIGYPYLKQRGISDDIIKKFGLGYAPGKGNSLCTYLLSEGVKEDDLIKLGLAKKGKNGLYDYFRNRVMFPIFNTNGKVIGFGGRAIGDAKPKYLNSAESEIFLKKNNLYALNFSKSAISENNKVIVVEGYMDAISLYQAGICNVVASLGTALTDNQAKLLSRYSKNVILSYDSDNAGINAALRGIDVITNAGGKPKILRINDGKDPDEFVKKNGKQAFEKLVDEAIYSTDFKLELLRKGYDLSNNLDVLEYIEKCIPVLKSLAPVERDIYIRKLSEEFGISEHAISLEIQSESEHKGGAVRSRDGFVARNSRQLDANLKLELSFIILAMNNTYYIKRISEDGIKIESPLAKKIWSAILKLSDKDELSTGRIDYSKILSELDPEEEAYFSKCLQITELGPDDELFYKECRASYISRINNEKKLEIQSRLAVAEKMGNSKEVEECLSELMKLDKLIEQ